MPKEKQTTVTESVVQAKPVVQAVKKEEKFSVSAEEMRFIEELRLHMKNSDALDKMKSLEKLELDAKREAEKEKQRIWGNKPVKGTFKYHEIQGGTLEFTFLKHKKDKIEKYSLKDGMEYTIPRDVAIHLNENGKYLIHQQSVDKDGKPLVTVGRKEDRYSFYSSDFVDVTDKNAASVLGPSPQIDIVSFK